MLRFFPLVYACLLSLSLGFLSFYLLKEFKRNLSLEKRLLSLEKKLQENKKSADSSYKLGQLYLHKKVYKKAIYLFRNALNFWDQNDKIGLGSLYNTLGFTYYKLKEYKHAIYYYNQAIQLLPDYTLALNNLGLVYESQQNYKEALALYKRLLVYDEKNKVASSRLGFLHQKLRLLT